MPEGISIVEEASRGHTIVTAVDAHDRDGDYWTAIYALHDKKSKADRWKGEHGWDDIGGGPNDFLRAAEEQPDLIASYYPILEKPREIGEFTALLDTIRKMPEYARSLQPIFKENPELVLVYGTVALSGIRFTPEQQAADAESQFFRVSASLDPEVIAARLTKNKEVYQTLVKKLDTITPKEAIPGYPYYDLSHPYDVATVRAIELPFGRYQRKSLRLTVTPTDPSGYDFLNQEVQLTEHGLVSTMRTAKQYKNLGYCMRQEGINEAQLVSALVDFPYQSPELQEALESIPSLYEMVD